MAWNTFTPREKLAAATTPMPASATSAFMRSSSSFQPVVPTTAFRPMAASRGRLTSRASAVEKSIATSAAGRRAASIPSPFALLWMSSRSTTSQPYEPHSRSTVLPMRP